MLRTYDDIDECVVTLGLGGSSVVFGVFRFNCDVVDFGVLSKGVKVFRPVFRKD